MTKKLPILWLKTSEVTGRYSNGSLYQMLIQIVQICIKCSHHFNTRFPIAIRPGDLTKSFITFILDPFGIYSQSHLILISPNLPFQVLDTNFLSCFIIIIIPFSVIQIDSSKFGTTVCSNSQPIPLKETNS